VLLGFAGIRALLELIRLRQAWFDSVHAMNTIKAYYIDREKSTEFEKAFKWRKLPAGFKTDSVSFLLALQTAVLSGLSLGTALAFTIWAAYDEVKGVLVWGGVAVVVVILIAAELRYYRHQLKGLRDKYGDPPNDTQVV
jgi:hypothetical protein